MSSSLPNIFLSIFLSLKCLTNRSENLVACYYSVICFLFSVSSPFDYEDFALARYPWLKFFDFLWKTILYYLVKGPFHEVPLIISICIWNSIFLFMISALRFSALFGSMLLLIFDFDCVWGITNVNQMGNWMVKCKNYLSLNKKDCHADGCFNLHPDERWLLYIFNLLLLQHHITSGNIKSLRWWFFQRMHC